VTKNEALERAALVWGKERVISVQDFNGNAPGMWWVNLRPAGRASDTRARNYSAHSLDANGHVNCHGDCKTLEP